MADKEGFSPKQQSYLQGFTLGADVARAVRGLPILSGSGQSSASITLAADGAAVNNEAINGPEAFHYEAQARAINSGKKLSVEEKAKREKNALDMWGEMQSHAVDDAFPKGTDVFLWKFHGLFYVSLAQDAFMCRMRFPGGYLKSYQFRGLADLSDQFAGGYTDVTTRANLQYREISAANGLNVLKGLTDLGILIKGSGGDNVRNVTATPTSGIDRHELIETLPLAREMHHHLLNHRELYGLPRKFNIAFEGGGCIASLDDTNDVGFRAAEVLEEHATVETPAGIYFQLTLGGITGHEDFARPTGVLLEPSECVNVADAILRVFVRNGDRTDRKRARLKYVLDEWGFDKFITEVETELGRTLRRFPDSQCQFPSSEDRLAHIGFHPQKQADQFYVGVALPVGRIQSDQMRDLADIADKFGCGEIRLTVWQNLLIPGIKEADIESVKAAIEATGLDWQTTNIRSGLVACTGNAGCKFAASNTKSQAMKMAAYLDERLTLDSPLNIHLTGCPNSCAQHYIGDIGMMGAQVEDENEELVEGYQVFVGGGWNDRRACGRELVGPTAFDQIPPIVERLIVGYQANRNHNDETFADFCRRHSIEELRELAAASSTSA